MDPEGGLCGVKHGSYRWGGPVRTLDLIYLLIPVGGMRYVGFHSRIGIKESCGWGPRGETVLICPLESHPYHCLISLCLPLSTLSLMTTITRLKTGDVMSSLLTSLSQSSIQMPKYMEDWGGLCPGPLGDLSVGRRESHRLAG